MRTRTGRPASITTGAVAEAASAVATVAKRSKQIIRRAAVGSAPFWHSCRRSSSALGCRPRGAWCYSDRRGLHARSVADARLAALDRSFRCAAAAPDSAAATVAVASAAAARFVADRDAVPAAAAAARRRPHARRHVPVPGQPRLLAVARAPAAARIWIRRLRRIRRRLLLRARRDVGGRTGLDGTPASAQVFVDGYYVATLADVEASRVLTLPAGPHRVEIRASDYLPTTF